MVTKYDNERPLTVIRPPTGGRTGAGVAPGAGAAICGSETGFVDDASMS
jgi:hypothetical protein